MLKCILNDFEFNFQKKIRIFILRGVFLKRVLNVFLNDFEPNFLKEIRIFFKGGGPFEKSANMYF